MRVDFARREVDRKTTAQVPHSDCSSMIGWPARSPRDTAPQLGRSSSSRPTETVRRRESGHLSSNLTVDLVRYEVKHITSNALASPICLWSGSLLKMPTRVRRLFIAFSKLTSAILWFATCAPPAALRDFGYLRFNEAVLQTVLPWRNASRPANLIGLVRQFAPGPPKRHRVTVGIATER
jgi:hypothetical protein